MKKNIMRVVMGFFLSSSLSLCAEPGMALSRLAQSPAATMLSNLVMIVLQMRQDTTPERKQEIGARLQELERSIQEAIEWNDIEAYKQDTEERVNLILEACAYEESDMECVQCAQFYLPFLLEWQLERAQNPLPKDTSLSPCLRRENADGSFSMRAKRKPKKPVMPPF